MHVEFAPFCERTARKPGTTACWTWRSPKAGIASRLIVSWAGHSSTLRALTWRCPAMSRPGECWSAPSTPKLRRQRTRNGAETCLRTWAS
eukprot:2081466-Amphidinium_carterae.1